VVGHDVEDLAEARLPESAGHPGVPGGAAQLVVEQARVDHVVAVGASPDRLQIRGAVHVGDTEVGQVGTDAGDVIKAESGVQMDPVRRPPNHAQLLPFS
jgi:hypothetical protein